jgi:hypothetical protein
MQKIHLAVVLLAGTLFAACGGRSVSGAAGGDSGGGTTPPTVASTSPTDNATYVGTATTISVTFSKAMNPLTVKAVTGGTSCITNSPTLQVSSNNFETCVPMTSATPTTSDNITFTMTPSSPLNTATTYKIRVTTGVQDSFGNALASQFETTNGFTTNPTQPIVTGTTPANGATGFDPFTGTITIHFSTTMNRSSATFNAAAGACTGNIQVSADDFTNCIGVSIPLGNNSSFTLTPTAQLSSATTYKVKVFSTLTDTSANAVSPFEHMTGIKTRYYRTEAIDGTNNFVAGETFATAQGGNGDIYLTADKDYLYVAMRHESILAGNTGSGNKFAYFLFATDLNDAQGLNTSSDGKAKFGTSSKMRWHWKTRVDGANYTEFRQANGTDWNTDWSANKNDWRADKYIEARILLTEFGGTAPSTIKVAAYIIDYYGDSGNGYLYNLLSGATEGSGATARDLVKYIDFNRTLSTVPNATATANF